MDISDIVKQSLSEIETATRKARVAQWLAPIVLPSEARIGFYDVYAGRKDSDISLSIEISYQPADGNYHEWKADTIPWKDRVRPIGQVMRAFHASGITRTVSDYGDVYYQARGTLHKLDWPEEDISIGLTVRVATGGISPACKVETVETTEVVTRTKVVVTCPEPAGSHA